MVGFGVEAGEQTFVRPSHRRRLTTRLLGGLARLVGDAVCYPVRPSVHSALSRKVVLVLGSDAASGLDMGWLRDMSSSSAVEFRQHERRGKKRQRPGRRGSGSDSCQSAIASLPLRSFLPRRARWQGHTHTWRASPRMSLTGIGPISAMQGSCGTAGA